ncbi:uncharacterized protein SOCEGT47_065890 [Sorangium cellulosum]|uniref:PEGA domain-containing protein n=2 Tax=Sorangium cellulosum TaxID=56 RepID=A0A4P2Q9V6_SORCE|nr:uncharacterized protein SOCEGT47_065890 [Sorangium cellulosum]
MSVPSEESERDLAVRDFEEGRKAHVAGRLEEAELLYLRAWGRMRSYDIAANLGQVQLLLKRPASAAKHLAYSLRTAPPLLEPERVDRMRAMLAEAKRQVVTVRVRVANVPDAEVFVDGERVPAEEVKREFYVDPGQHTLAIRRTGYDERVMPLLAAPGAREEITTELNPKAETGAANGAAIGNAATKAHVAGARVEEPRSWVPVIALGAASAVGLGVAVGFTVTSNGASADVEAQRAAILDARAACIDAPAAYAGACEELHDTASRADAFGNAARVAYAASGLLAVAAVTYAAWPRDRGAATRVVLVPRLHASGAEIAVVGTW